MDEPSRLVTPPEQAPPNPPAEPNALSDLMTYQPVIIYGAHIGPRTGLFVEQTPAGITIDDDGNFLFWPWFQVQYVQWEPMKAPDDAHNPIPKLADRPGTLH